MPFESGTATDQNDLMDKFKTFVTTGLGGAGFNWTARKDTVVAASPANGANRYIIFEAPGGGSDQIFMGLELNMTEYNDGPLEKWYRPYFRVQGYNGFNANLGFDNQPTPIPTYNNVPTFCCEYNRQLPYHFIVNGRRAIIAVRSEQFWQTCYMGWYLPYATPAQAPYPLIVAGSNWTGQSDQDEFWKGTHFAWPEGSHDTDRGSNLQHMEGANWVAMQGRIWPFFDYYPTGSHTNQYDNSQYWLDDEYGSSHGDATYPLLLRNIDGTVPLLRCHLTGDESGEDTFGVLEGVFAVGAGLEALQNDIAQINGEDYLIVSSPEHKRNTSAAIAIHLD